MKILIILIMAFNVYAVDRTKPIYIFNEGDTIKASDLNHNSKNTSLITNDSQTICVKYELANQYNIKKVAIDCSTGQQISRLRDGAFELVNNSLSSCLDYYNTFNNGDGLYWLTNNSITYKAYCDMTNGGWTLSFALGATGGGSILSMKFANDSNYVPITKTTRDVSSIGLSYLPSYTLIKFTGSNNPKVKYIFRKSDFNNARLISIFNGPAASGSCSQSVIDTIYTIDGLSVKFRHNNGGTEPFDITSIGLIDSVWQQMLWGSIDEKEHHGGIVNSQSYRKDGDRLDKTQIVQIWVK